MKNSLLITLIKSLEPHEFKELDKYVRSPLFMRRKNAARFFDIIKKHYPAFESNSINKKNVYKKLFPGNVYNDTMMRKLISELLRMVKGYLVYNNFTCKEFNIYRHLANELNFRGINRNNLFTKTIDKALALLEAEKVRDDFYYFYKFDMETERNLADSDLTHTSHKRNWQVPFENLLGFVLISLMDHYIVLYTQMKETNHYYRLDMMDEVLSFMDSSNYRNKPVFSLYYNILKLLLNPENSVYYFKAEKILKKDHCLLKRSYASGACVQLLNFCIGFIEKGYLEFTSVKFNFCKWMIKNKYCYESGHMISKQFTIMVTLSLELGKIEYAESFINIYKSKLFPPLRGNVLALCKAMIALYKKDYHKAREHLGMAKVVSYVDRLRIKTIEIMIACEEDSIETAFSHIDSAKHFLAENKFIGQQFRERHLNFLNAVNMILKAKTSDSKRILIKLSKSKSSRIPIANRMWLEKYMGSIPQNIYI